MGGLSDLFKKSIEIGQIITYKYKNREIQSL